MASFYVICANSGRTSCSQLALILTFLFKKVFNVTLELAELLSWDVAVGSD
jgi:hypothetical protein